jgi:hypothetical protein
MKKILNFFGVSFTVTIIGLLGVLVLFGLKAFWIAALLVLLEVTLSFDNAVVNARVLQKMNAVWQHRFLTWGIFIAVFGTRFVLPILIVSVVAWSSPLVITQLALFDPAQYGILLESSRYAIHSFGAAFLLMVALKYFLDTQKELHWIEILEKQFPLILATRVYQKY